MTPRPSCGAPQHVRLETKETVIIRAKHLGTAVALLPFILVAPMFGLSWELRPPMLPVLLTCAFLSPFLAMGWISTRAWRGSIKLVLMSAVLVAGALMVLTSLVFVLFQATTMSLPLEDGCRVDAKSVGGFGDTLLVVSEVCPRAGLWQRSRSLLSDEEAVLKALRQAPAAADGAAQVALTLGRHGKPDEEALLRLPGH